MKYADVIIPLAVEGMYTYLIPDDLEDVVEEGTLVLLSFAGNKKYTAVEEDLKSTSRVNFQSTIVPSASALARILTMPLDR
jgi:primosomal protein N' (replication factor Y)